MRTDRWLPQPKGSPYYAKIKKQFQGFLPDGAYIVGSEAYRMFTLSKTPGYGIYIVHNGRVWLYNGSSASKAAANEWIKKTNASYKKQGFKLPGYKTFELKPYGKEYAHLKSHGWVIVTPRKRV